ncbi:MAG: MotA/TolQ/ExbB proton channel family protein [Planctomycetota bacterium]
MFQRVPRIGPFLVVLLLLIAAAPAWSQTPGAPEPPPELNVKYFDFFVVKGGWIAYLIITLSVVAVALTVEYCISIRRATIIPPQAVHRAMQLIDERKYLEAIQFTAEDPSMACFALNAALREAPNGFSAMERALEEAIEERSAKLYRKIEYLNIIGAVSPMIGLFGTVVGMILLFAAIHASDTFPRAQIVADKVSIALVATFWGLAVAIPSLSIYAVFRNRIEVMTAECAIAADRMLAVFKPGASPARPTPLTGGAS